MDNLNFSTLLKVIITFLFTVLGNKIVAQSISISEMELMTKMNFSKIERFVASKGYSYHNKPNQEYKTYLVGEASNPKSYLIIYDTHFELMVRSDKKYFELIDEVEKIGFKYEKEYKEDTGGIVSFVYMKPMGGLSYSSHIFKFFKKPTPIGLFYCVALDFLPKIE